MNQVSRHQWLHLCTMKSGSNISVTSALYMNIVYACPLLIAVFYSIF